MRRKLVQQGTTTLMISLPAKWLKRYNLVKGDEINLEEADENILISKQGIEARKETEINLTKQTETGIRTLITNAYRAGYDIVKVKFDNQTQLETLQNSIKEYLLGYDITKKEEHFCIVENITEPSSHQFDALFRKIFFNIKELIQITKNRLQGKQIPDYKEITQKIHQYDSFCRRVIAKRQKEVKDPNLHWAFQTLLIHGQRDLYHLNKFLDKNETKASKEIIELFNDLDKLFTKLTEAYLKQDTTLLEEIHEREKELIYKKAYALLKSKRNGEAIIIHHVMDSIRNFYLASSPLMGLFLR